MFDYRNFQPVPQLTYTRDEQEANQLVSQLQGPLGFDMEWRVDNANSKTVPEVVHKTALIQLADTNRIVLIHLAQMQGFPQRLREVLESPGIVKAGLAISGDKQKLLKDYGIRMNNVVDVFDLAKRRSPAFYEAYKWRTYPLKLTDMSFHYLGVPVEKDPAVILSNWEAYPLTDRQIIYAANDAYVCVRLHAHIMTLVA